MKVALITIWHIGNYGAEMQAYATLKAINRLGHDCQIIDLRLTDTLPPTLKQTIANKISKHSKISHKFNSFWNEFMPNRIRYTSLHELQNNPPKADIYLVGSDQVWNPELTGEISKAFFLDFGEDDKYRASYASSFGVSDFSNSKSALTEYSTLLKRFNHISCREQTGVDLLKKYFGISASHVLDPTLLHKDYPEITGKLKDENTLVFYPVSNDVREVEILSKELSNNLGLRYVNANYRKPLYGSIKWDGLSVKEWLKTIGQAKFVITPSFHGVTFSLIYHRQFVVVGTNKKRSSRITDLLSSLGLAHRIYGSIDEILEGKPWEQEIDYNVVDAKLSLLRNQSWDYLKSSLNTNG